jgi:hypothetical protein
MVGLETPSGVSCTGCNRASLVYRGHDEVQRRQQPDRRQASVAR